jgi:hypothetical protein
MMTEKPDDIERLIGELNSLEAGERASAQLILRGAAAIEPLAAFLLTSRPESIFQPRRWAVETLGALGATDVLIEYLNCGPVISDPVVNEGERIVADAAVAELANHSSPEILQFFLRLANSRMLPALAKAFGRYRVLDAMPYLDRALEDDRCRSAAEEALLQLGVAARNHLTFSAITPLPSYEEELPSSLLRRRSALAVLQDIGIDIEQHWPRLETLLDSPDPGLVVGVCVLALEQQVPIDVHKAVRRLIIVSPTAPWRLHDQLFRCFDVWYRTAEALITTEVRARLEAPATIRAWDGALLLFRRVLRAHGHKSL